MHFHKQSKTWYWMCNRRVNGVKCNRGKFTVTDGTMFSKSHLSIADIIWIIWHFLHLLSEKQCKQSTNIGQNNCKTVVKWYNKCRDVCGKWIWANKPKLGGMETLWRWTSLISQGFLSIARAEEYEKILGNSGINGYLD